MVNIKSYITEPITAPTNNGQLILIGQMCVWAYICDLFTLKTHHTRANVKRDDVIRGVVSVHVLIWSSICEAVKWKWFACWDDDMMRYMWRKIQRHQQQNGRRRPVARAAYMRWWSVRCLLFRILNIDYGCCWRAPRTFTTIFDDHHTPPHHHH